MLKKHAVGFARFFAITTALLILVIIFLLMSLNQANAMVGQLTSENETLQAQVQSANEAKDSAEKELAEYKTQAEENPGEEAGGQSQSSKSPSVIYLPGKNTTTTKVVEKTITEYVYVYVEPEPQPTPEPEPVEDGNAQYQSDVTSDMTVSSFWANKLSNANEVLCGAAGIENINKATLGTSATNMNDLENAPATVNAASLRSIFGNAATPSRTLYRNDTLLEGAEKEAYFQAMRDKSLAATVSEEEPIKYGIMVSRASMRDWPTEDFLGYSATDTDDEMVSSALNVNEPVVVEFTTGDGEFCYVRSTNCTGWIPAKCVGICKDKDEWLDAWKVDAAAKDFLVVTSPRIVLEPSVRDVSSNLELMLGTVLKMVPEGSIPSTIDQRSAWNNYVVYLPQRDQDGNYVKAVGLIPQYNSNNVHVGYYEFTQSNVLDVALNCLGARYGWGGMQGTMDCSMYVRSIYKCFGFEMPRNTTWQCAMPTEKVDMSAMSVEEKEAVLDSLPAGALLHFNGHITMYLGKHDGKYYVVSDTGSVADHDGQGVRQVFNIVITSTDVLRGNGSTWMQNFNYALCPWKMN